MSFIRKKKINGNDFAYLVTNKWTDKGSRQKAKYLGKITLFPKTVNLSMNEYVFNNHKMNLEQFFKSKSKEDIVKELLEFELLQRGFHYNQTRIGKNKELCLNNGKHFLNEIKILKASTSKEIIAEMNEGFLCSYTINNLLNCRPKGYDEREQGIQLAKVLLEAGLKVESEMFVIMFEKWIKS